MKYLGYAIVGLIFVLIIGYCFYISFGHPSYGNIPNELAETYPKKLCDQANQEAGVSGKSCKVWTTNNATAVSGGSGTVVWHVELIK